MKNFDTATTFEKMSPRKNRMSQEEAETRLKGRKKLGKTKRSLSVKRTEWSEVE